MTRKKAKASVEDRMSMQAANQIREARQRKGMPMHELASRIGVSLSLACLWESGERSVNCFHLAALNKVLEISLRAEDVLSPMQKAQLAKV